MSNKDMALRHTLDWIYTPNDDDPPPANERPEK